MSLVSVSRDTFFSVIMNKKLDVHPRSTPHKTFWETPSRVVVGITTPGYLAEGPKTYQMDNGFVSNGVTAGAPK